MIRVLSIVAIVGFLVVSAIASGLYLGFAYSDYKAEKLKTEIIAKEKAREDWDFIGCMNSKLAIEPCQSVKPFDNQVQCMSTVCGRPNAHWTTFPGGL